MRMTTARGATLWGSLIALAFLSVPAPANPGGQSLDPPPPALIRFTSPFPGGFFGISIDRMPDLDGDGADDLVAGAPLFSSARGAAVVLSGRTGVALAGVMGELGSAHGFSVAALDDVNGDGVADYAVGIPLADGPLFSFMNNLGSVAVRSGADDGLIYSVAGDAPADFLGVAVACLGDLDGDGVRDFVAGADSVLPIFGPAYARVYSGATGIELFTHYSTVGSDGLGRVVADAGDVNGDGIPDVLVGAPFDSSVGFCSGRVFALSGADGAVLLDLVGGAADDLFGASLSRAGDVDGDGCGDFLVGAPQSRPPSFPPGYARIYSGATGAVLSSFQGFQPAESFGFSVTLAGDMDGDGVDDVVIGSPTFSPSGVDQRGRATAFSGADGTILRSFVGETGGEQRGNALAPAGDVNGDGFADVFVASWRENSDAGAIRVMTLCGARRYGQSSDASQALTLSWVGGPPTNVAQGIVGVGGASPFSAGAILLGAAPSDLVIGGVRLLVDTSPLAFAVLPFVYGPIGVAFAPVDLSVPQAAGAVVYAQAFEANATAPAGIFWSNGLALILCP